MSTPPIPATTRPDDVQHATICYPVVDGDVICIRKKRGLGAGVVNGPGGKVEDGESPRACARRETREEIGVQVAGLRKRGEFSFYLGADPEMQIHVFVADDVTGDPVETPEAAPLRVSVPDLPVDRMWESDRLWVPRVLAGERFVGTIQFDAEEAGLLAHDLQFGPDVPDRFVE